MRNHVQDEAESKQLLITVDEAAHRLSIGRSHIYDQMQRGALRSIRIGRSRRTLETDLARLIEGLLESPALRELEQHGLRNAVKRIPTRSRRR